jgi:hypothetical protein
MIPQPPTSFSLSPLGGGWHHWQGINECFWPGRGKRAVYVNAQLASARERGGVYLLAWSRSAPQSANPTDRAVRYVGETSCYCKRMGGFGNSAAFWGDRRDGHSAARRWPVGRNEHLWIAFFPLGEDLEPHLARGLRRWMEAVAIEVHREVHGIVPRLNNNGRQCIELD